MENTMTKLPAMPKNRKAKPSRPCACGCGRLTKGTWFPGDDGRATGWATRILKGLLTIEDVPENERAGAVIMLSRHGATVEVPKTKAELRRERKAERIAAAAAAMAAHEAA